MQKLSGKIVQRAFMARLFFVFFGMMLMIPPNLSAANSQPSAVDYSAELAVAEIAAAVPAGTPAREENEFKLEVSGNDSLLRHNSYLISRSRRVLERAFSVDSGWKATRHSGSDYYVLDAGQGTFCFLDIYLDTDDGLNYVNDVSYRVRYRWHSRGAMWRYMLGSSAAADLPHRCEYQLKIYDKKWENGFNNCLETRFEFRNESYPFKADRSAPPQPWPFEQFVRPAIDGRFRDFFVNTAHDYAAFLRNRPGVTGIVKLKPSLLVVTTRRRIHVGLKNEFGVRAAQLGLGAIENADQTILTTIDCSEVYPPEVLDVYHVSRYAQAHNSLTPRLRRRLKASIVPVSSFTEYEFEFERNVESALRQEIAKAADSYEKARLEQIKADYLADVAMVAKILSTSLSETGLTISPGRMSKYRKAWQALHGTRQPPPASP